MKIKEVYVKNKNRRFCTIKEMKKEGISIKSSPLKTIKKHSYKFLIGALLLILILLLTFYKDLVAFGVSVGLFAFFAIACILINTYSITCKEKTLYMTLNFQKFELPYERIANIYLSKDFNTTNFIPQVNYSLVIRYIDNLNLIKELSFSTLFLKAEEVKEFLDNFIIQEKEEETCINYEKYKFGKKILKLAGFVLFVIVIGIFVYLAAKK